MSVDTRPALERGLGVERCLSFTVRGPWGHFRRVDGNIVKQTYRVMPRTTVAGLIAAMVGYERDSYYDLFAPDSSAMAITPAFDIRTFNLPVNALSTDKGAMSKVPKRARKGVIIRYPNAAKKNRQQHNYEMLVDPAYRIDCWLADEDAYDTLEYALREGKAKYTPSLGLSECLASITYHGERKVEPDDGDRVESAVPGSTANLVPTPGTEYATERSPAFMTIDTDGPRTRRRTTGFADWVYTTRREDDLKTTAPTSRVDDRSVVFI